MDIEAAEEQLLGLARRVPEANHAREEGEGLVYLLANRGVTLYRGFRNAMNGPSTATPLVDARALVELAIRLKWVMLNPAVNAAMYFGASEGADLKALRALDVIHE